LLNGASDGATAARVAELGFEYNPNSGWQKAEEQRETAGQQKTK